MQGSDRTIRRRAAAGRALIAGLVLAVVGVAAAPYAAVTHAARPAAKGTINLGNKGFTEEFIVADLYQLLLQKHGYNVSQKNLGETPIVQKAIMGGSIDMYPEYTGTGLTVVLKRPAISNASKAYLVVKSQYEKVFHLTWLAQGKFNDTNAFAVKAATAAKYHLKTLSDLAKSAPSLTFAALTACTGRMDCLEGLKKVYGINFKSVQSLDSQALIYSALTGGQADVAEVFGTDPQIKADNLVVLADNKGIAPADHIAPVVRDSTLKKDKDIPMILNPLAKYLTTTAMIKMNAQVALQHQNPLAVARAFLKSKHLI